MESNNITAALAAFHTDVGTIEKTARAQYGQFADLSTVLSAITPALSKNGLALVQTFDMDGDDDVLVTTIYHTSGETISSRARMVRVAGAGGRQNPLHLWGGSVTYQRRYAALALVGLAAGMQDDDGDIADPPPQAKAQPQKVTPTKMQPWDDREHADRALDLCKSQAELRSWAQRTAASVNQMVISDEERADLIEAYKERMAMMQEVPE